MRGGGITSDANRVWQNRKQRAARREMVARTWPRNLLTTFYRMGASRGFARAESWVEGCIMSIIDGLFGGLYGSRMNL